MSSRKRVRRAPRSSSPRSAPRPSQPPPDDEVVVKLGGPGDLVASLPSMLGFVPEESVIAVAMHRRGARSRVGGMARIDLVAAADAPERAEIDRVLTDAIVQRLGPAVPDSLVVVVVSEADPVGRPPHGGLVDALTEAFAAIGVPVTSAVWTARVAAGALWRCYDDCGCTGVLADPTGTLAAAETAATGRVTYGSRAEVDASLAPDPAAGARRRRELVDDAHQAALTDRELSGLAAARRDLDAVRHAAAEVGRGVVLTEDEIARLAVALCDPRVRDVCLGFAAGHDDAVDPDHAWQLWTLLMRAVPAPEVAEPATLLAFATLDHGGGATLTTALVRAMDADPGHQLSRLLGSIVAAGMDPADVREMVAGASAEAGARLAA
ncbi:MAG TPA: DUF4192 domain-containing protein [Actinomycetospora sp.]|uniref:DUF4192 domain-containing protein n=1 Tax=Actinomycetospora sp. TaxID=1872135 RepID=UPI002F40BEB6